jgi:hypothetical protein
MQLKGIIQRLRAHYTRSDRGQIIVEVMVGLAVVTISFTGFFGLLRTAIGMSSYVADNYRATYLASEGVEIAKNILDRNFVERDTRAFNEGLELGSAFSSADGSWHYEVSYDDPDLKPRGPWLRPIMFDGARYGYAAGEQTPFTREIIIKDNGSSIIVRSIVSWSVKGAPFSIELADTFYHWWDYQDINSQDLN